MNEAKKSDEVYRVYDLIRIKSSSPGEVEAIRVRARDEGAARLCAGAHRGEESSEEWTNPERSHVFERGTAVTQRHGIIMLWAHGWTAEVEARFPGR